MGAPKGNQFAKGNKGGRPRIVSLAELQPLGEKLIDFALEHLENLDTHKNPLFIRDFAKTIPCTIFTLENYSKRDKEFFKCYKEFKDIQKEVLIRGGLKGYFNPTAFIFTAKNITDMRDQTHTDLTSGGKTLTGVDIRVRHASQIGSA